VFTSDFDPSRIFRFGVAGWTTETEAQNKADEEGDQAVGSISRPVKSKQARLPEVAV